MQHDKDRRDRWLEGFTERREVRVSAKLWYSMQMSVYKR